MWSLCTIQAAFSDALPSVVIEHVEHDKADRYDYSDSRDHPHAYEQRDGQRAQHAANQSPVLRDFSSWSWKNNT